MGKSCTLRGNGHFFWQQVYCLTAGDEFLPGHPPSGPPVNGGKSPSPLTGRVGVGPLNTQPYAQRT